MANPWDGIANWDSPEFANLDVDAYLQGMTASAAQYAFDTGEGVVPEDIGEISEGAEFVIPLLIPEDVESGDGRRMEKGALSTRNLPIALLWQPATGDGHAGSYIVGRLDSIEEVEGGLGNARGVFDTGPYGREAERLVRARMLRGVSADLDMFEATIDGDGNELAEDIDPNTIKNEKMTVKKARVMAATLVAKPAFQECTIELVLDGDMDQDIPVNDGIYEETPPVAAAAEAALSALAASAAPVNPPLEWFDNPNLDEPTPLTVTDDGRVFGHVATWDTDHIGYTYGVRPPKSKSNYAYFRTGLVRTAEGEDVAVGQLTLAGGHAPLDSDARMAVKHYDDTASAVADVTAGEDAFGIWVAGGLRPGVTADQVRTLRASAPSGDWRPINGHLELVAVCQVNVPGFPIARARVASGAVMALVAAGASTLHKLRNSETEELAARLSAVENKLLEQRKNELSAKVQQVRDARKRQLTEAAALARASFAPELERRAQELAALHARAEEIRKKFNEFALDLHPGDTHFREDLHPRDDEGKFRRVLGKLNELLKMESDFHAPDAVEAQKSLEKAADLEDAGDAEGAKAAAEDAKAKIETAADQADEAPSAPGVTPETGDDKDSPNAGGRVKAALKDVANDIGQAVGAAVDAAKSTDDGNTPPIPTPDEIPEPIRDLIDTLIDDVGEGVDPMTIVSRLDTKVKAWLEGKGFKSPEDMAKVIERMMQRPIQPDIGQ